MIYDTMIYFSNLPSSKRDKMLSDLQAQLDYKVLFLFTLREAYIMPNSVALNYCTAHN